MHIVNILRLMVPAALMLCMVSCKKYLDQKPDATLTTPESIGDLELLLDNYTRFNNSYTSASEILVDDYYLNTPEYNAVLSQTERDLYLFQANEETDNFYNIGYASIFWANTILDELENLNPETYNAQQYADVRGRALFFRAFYYYYLSQVFAQPYDSVTADRDLGLALRLSADVNEVSVRSSVKKTYEQIIADFKESLLLLSPAVSLKTRPSRPAVYGALAKTYLAMQKYDSAWKYADLCINNYGPDSLLDFNIDISVNSSAPFRRFNREVIFHARSSPTASILSNSRAKIDSGLYQSYASNDRRKIAYFKSNNNGTYQFKGDYDQSGTSTGFAFTGIVMDEMYLIRAEGYARIGNVTFAMLDLNKLLRTRWTTGTFVEYIAADANAALRIILTERRKELIRRGTRWTDLRRFIKEPSFTEIPKRFINNQLYELQPNSPRYTLKIPASAIVASGMQQNP